MACLFVVVTAVIVGVAVDHAHRVARDKQRKRDLQTLKAALVTYYYDHGKYPNTDYQGLFSHPGYLTPDYLKKILIDPEGSIRQPGYSYEAKCSGKPPSCLGFVLDAHFENRHDRQKKPGTLNTYEVANR